MDKSYLKSKRLTKIKKATKEKIPFILIICEGEKTEPNYFKSIKLLAKDVATLNIEGLGRHTLELIKKAKQIKRRKEKDKNIKYEEVWVVFDKDSFSDEDFNLAILEAENQGFKVAYSNQCFEIWYFLHFWYCESFIEREELFMKVDEIFNKNYKCCYKKNAENIYSKINDRQNVAIEHAKKLKIYHTIEKHSPAKSNPSTTVYLLIEKLNKYI